jgi:hypothetical protein
MLRGEKKHEIEPKSLLFTSTKIIFGILYVLYSVILLIFVQTRSFLKNGYEEEKNQMK